MERGQKWNGVYPKLHRNLNFLASCERSDSQNQSDRYCTTYLHKISKQIFQFHHLPRVGPKQFCVLVHLICARKVGASQFDVFPTYQLSKDKLNPITAYFHAKQLRQTLQSLSDLQSLKAGKLYLMLGKLAFNYYINENRQLKSFSL